ncbi:GAF domain-containing protein [Massilia sp. CCM 8694]|uniref:histidine kinase n=2 Tax=Massilia genomosp. 1 TaxID=2609280 RepID=A0ABX0MV53_9BURK|nr:GAF domain-containing protein [Massilia genomosp. 1]
MLRLTTRPNATLFRLALAWLLGVACVGAALAAPVRSLRFEHIGLEQGLSQESVQSILQDRQGFMWFGTQAGLNRYDGYRMTVFKNDPADPDSIADNYISASFEDDQGRLWFGTKGGLIRYDRATRKFIRYASAGNAADGMNNRVVSAIVADGGGGLWLATGEGLKHFDPASARFATLRHDPGDATSLSDDRVNALVRDTDGSLWVATARGLDRLARGAQRFERFTIASGGDARRGDARRNQVLSLSLGANRTLWVGTGAGLEAWQLGAAQPARRQFGEADGIGAVRVQSLYHDAKGKLWAGTELDGLFLRDPASGAFVSYRHQPLDRHSLSDNRIAASFLDRSGTLWVGSWFGGVNRVDIASGGFNRLAHVPDDPASLSSNKIRALAADGHGTLWLGTTGGGVNKVDLEKGSVTRLRAGELVTALAVGVDRVWVGTPTGLSSMDKEGGHVTPLPLGGDANASYIQRLLIDRAGKLWILTRGGVARYDPASDTRVGWRHDPHNPHSLGENHGFAIVEDQRGIIWIGTDNGLERLDPATSRFTHYRYDPADAASLRHNRIYYLFESRAGQLWAGTAGGLHRVEPGADGKVYFRFYALNGAGAADPIGGIVEDDAGMLWVSSTAGLARLDPSNGQVKHYTARDGLIDGSYFVGAAARSGDGSLHFGGINGLTSFHPEAIRENPYPPAVMITDFLIFNRPLRAGQQLGDSTFKGAIEDAREITLSYRDSVLSLEFAALHFADPQRNRYLYQLEGFDQGWVSTDAGKRFATYTNLDPGRYVFRVRASNKDGVWNQAPTALAITITPPAWKTWWFRLALAALVAGVGYALLRLRVRALVRQKSLLERLVGSRTAELRLQKDSVERQKAEVEQAHRNIALLSDIGRKLTAKLDSESIMLMLYAHVNELMDASVFGIGLYRPERACIDYPFAMEGGKRYLPYSRSMDQPNQLAVWCITNEREVFINDLEKEYGNYIGDLLLTSSEENLGTLEDGSLPTTPRSLLYVPIAVNGRMLGVVSVHSYATNAYERIHLDMLRTLASYVGVAFDNADAYRQLQSTQAQLVAQEKLAALGSLVAGVAHELNTPIGNSLLMASTLQEKTSEIAGKFDGATIRRSDLKVFIDASQEASELIMRSLFNAADLLNSFKQVAVDQASAQRRRFDLEQAAHEIVATMMNQVRKAGHTLTLTVEPGIEMESYPGPFGQVMINLINNALLHAFEGRVGGAITVTAGLQGPERVLLVFVDDGVGIPVEHQARIFDPFFTTKMGQGGSGLGLNITYNIVTSLLEGGIRVESGAGRGTTFFIDLPLRVGAQANTHKEMHDHHHDH